MKRGTVSMSKLGQLGRFGNQVCQYFFLKTYAELHGLDCELPSWAGSYLFGHQDPPVSQNRPAAVDGRDFDSAQVLTAALASPGMQAPLVDVDIEGFFTFHPRVFKPLEARFRAMFQPTAAVRAAVDPLVSRVRERGRTVVAIHLRRGDFGYASFWIAPTSWYLAWLEEIWDTLDAPVLFLATDSPNDVVPVFAKYGPVTFHEKPLEREHYYPDFYMLTQADIVATSNSTFSVVASMLNDRARIFARPHPTLRKLIPFDPWLTECLTSADAGDVAKSSNP